MDNMKKKLWVCDLSINDYPCRFIKDCEYAWGVYKSHVKQTTNAGHGGWCHNEGKYKGRCSYCSCVYLVQK